MTTENPFEDVERAVAEAIARQLEIVQELDGMDVNVTSWEADFLESVLKQLKVEKRALSQPQLDVLHRMCETYDINFDDYSDGKK